MSKNKLTMPEERELHISTLEEAIEKHGKIKRSDYETEIKFLTLQICYDIMNRKDKKRVQELWRHIDLGKTE